jgi:hypothetical protein
MAVEISEVGSLPGADGAFVGVAPDGHTVVVARRGRATVWHDDELRHTVATPGYTGGAIVFDPGGTLCRLGHWTVDIRSGRVHAGSADIELLTSGLEFEQRAPARFYGVGASAVSPDGTRMASTFRFTPSKGIGDDVRNPGSPGQLVLVDPSAGEFIAVLEDTSRLSADRVIAIDASHVVAAGSGVGVWRASDGIALGGADGRPSLVRSDVRLSPAGTRFAATRVDGTVEFGSLESVDEAIVWTAHAGRATALAFHPHGHLLATGGHDRQVKLWAVSDHGVAELVGSHTIDHRVVGLAFDPSGDRLMVATGRTVIVAKISADHG